MLGLKYFVVLFKYFLMGLQSPGLLSEVIHGAAPRVARSGENLISHKGYCRSGNVQLLFFIKSTKLSIVGSCSPRLPTGLPTGVARSGQNIITLKDYCRSGNAQLFYQKRKGKQCRGLPLGLPQSEFLKNGGE